MALPMADQWAFNCQLCIVNCCNGNCNQRKKYIHYGDTVYCNPKSLSKMSMEILMENLTTQNVLECLMLADAIDSQRLLQKSKSFIRYNKSCNDMKAAWKKLDPDAIKTCLEIMLEIRHHIVQGENAINYSFIYFLDRESSLEDICLSILDNGLSLQNVINVLINSRRLGAKKLLGKVDRFMWNHIKSRSIKDLLKVLLRTRPKFFLKVASCMIDLD